MRSTVLSILLLLSIAANGQGSVEDTFSVAFCGCLENKEAENQLTEEGMEACIYQSAEEVTPLLNEEMGITQRDSTYEVGYEFGQQLWGRVEKTLIQTCGTYLKLMDNLRSSGLDEIDRDSLRSELRLTKKVKAQDQDRAFFNSRGILYFKLGKFGKASKDFDKALSLDRGYFPSIYFKAWSLEKMGRFDEATSLYESLFERTGSTEFLIFSGISRQKKKGW